MQKVEHTYQTPAGALLNEPERPGALYYGFIHRNEWHEVAVIGEEDGELLCSGPTFFGRVPKADFVRDADDDEAPVAWQGEIL